MSMLEDTTKVTRSIERKGAGDIPTEVEITVESWEHDYALDVAERLEDMMEEALYEAMRND